VLTSFEASTLIDTLKEIKDGNLSVATAVHGEAP
jgi:hypothetical protein